MGNSQSTNSAITPVEQVIRPQEPSTSVQVSPRLSDNADPLVEHNYNYKYRPADISPSAHLLYSSLLLF
jgi:hypothetical protein